MSDGANVLRVDLKNGKFFLINEKDKHLLDFSWRYAKSRNTGYILRGAPSFNRKRMVIFMHHAIMGRPLNGLFIDHINGNGFDNRRENLRIVTHRQNCQNMRNHRGEKPKSSKYLGVCKDFRKGNGKIYELWKAFIVVNGRFKNLGYFKSEEAASEAYQLKVKELYGEI